MSSIHWLQEPQRGRYPIAMYLLVAMFLFAAVIWLAATPAVAATTEDNAINWWLMIMQLAGGLALFLYGMEKMGEALKVVAGDRLREVLGKLTTNRIMGLITGTGVTAVIQSSSVTTVMLVGFVSAGVMSLSQAIGVILGADIGTTITAQIVAFKVTKYALGLVAIGFVLVFAGKTEKANNYGSLIMGLGLIFFGLGVMSAGMKPLRTYEPFIQLMQEVSNPVIGILIATAFTALVQSSSATTGVIIALATQGLITLEGGIALALGANIGTCATAGLACIGKPREAIRVAVAHVTFKIIGVLLIIWFIPPFADFVRLISPASEGLTGIDKLAADTPRQVANAHTLFNVGIAFLFLPFTNQFARFCEWVVADKPVSAAEEAAALFKPRYLDDLLINTPPLALSMVRRETSRMGEVVEQMLGAVPEAVFVGDVDKMTRVRETDDQVDALYGAINRYLAEVAQHNMGAEFSDEALTFVSVASELENIGDIMETHMYHLTEVCQASDISFSETQLEMLNSYHAKLVSAYKSALAGVEHNRREAAKIALDMEEEIVGGMDKFVLESQARFLREEHTPQEAAAFTLQTDIMENFKRIYEHIKRIARLVTHEEYRTALIVAT